MSSTPMTLTARIRNISGLAALAAASEDMAWKAQTDALEHAHWQAYDGAVKSLLALTSSPEGQEALKEMERLAVSQPERDDATQVLVIQTNRILDGREQ